MGKHKKIFGQCHICGKQELLSFEHVPPQAALNKNKMLMMQGVEIIGKETPNWISNGKTKEPFQGGIGEYTLCNSCNNNTGAWYGRHFVNFVNYGLKNTINVQKHNKQILEVRFLNVNPLMVIKQILAMFFSINFSTFSNCNRQLRDLLLEKNKRYINTSTYSIGIYVLVGDVGRRIGLSGITDIFKHESRTLSELCHPPFGYVLEINPSRTNKSPYCDITYFANDFEPNSIRDFTLQIPVLESNSIYPADYRTKEEILKEGECQNFVYLINDKRFSFGKMQ